MLTDQTPQRPARDRSPTRPVTGSASGTTSRALRAAPFLAILMLAACSAPKPEPTPTPPTKQPLPPRPPAPPPPPAASNWEDWPFTPGTWAYRADAKGSIALFGPTNQGALFTIRCDRGAQRIYLSRPGNLDAGRSANMVIRASTSRAQYPLANTGSTPPYVAAALAPTDPILDAAAFSRGRFVVEVAGAPTPLVIPTYPEFARVVEDCR